jgi:hypothetical protein
LKMQRKVTQLSALRVRITSVQFNEPTARTLSYLKDKFALGVRPYRESTPLNLLSLGKVHSIGG